MPGRLKCFITICSNRVATDTDERAMVIAINVAENEDAINSSLSFVAPVHSVVVATTSLLGKRQCSQADFEVVLRIAK